MRNTGRKKEQGFTLAEMLLTVGIMVILAGISFVALTQYQRKLKLLEMDGTAQELFMAAQNQMSTLEANGTLELLSETDLGILCADASTADDEGAGAEDANAGHRYYALIHNAGDNVGSAGEGLLSHLLPFGVIDDTVLTGGNYRIEYDYTAKTVTAVYYSKTASFLSGAGDAYTFKTDGSDAAALKKAAGDKTLRQHFDGTESVAKLGAIVGYYGGDSKTVPDGELTAPVLSIENGARLLLKIRMPRATGEANAETVLYVRGKESGNEVTIALKNLTGVAGNDLSNSSGTKADGNVFYMACPTVSAGEDPEYVLCLDSVTEKESHFSQLFPSLTPGEDIEIYAKTSSTDGYALEVKSNTVSANSLFASVETESVTHGWNFVSTGMGSLTANETNTIPVAMIANVRHLENLDPDVSGLSTDTNAEYCIQAAVQTDDLIYASTSPVKDYANEAVANPEKIDTKDTFASEIAKYNSAVHGSLSVYDLKNNGSTGYRPIQNVALLSYDGKGNRMVNFSSENAVNGGQGIFAGFSTQKNAKMVSIRDLQLINCKFSNTEGAAVGALVGVLGDGHQIAVQGIETENCQLSSEGNVGGLIGTVEAGGSDSANVKLYVNECGILGEYGSVNGSNAGGLIGSLTGSDNTYIANSTASVYVEGKHNAGGFIGSVSGTAEIRFSYVGGHTKEGKYPEDDTEAPSGQGRWNVLSAAGNAGGFIGHAMSAKLELAGCYSTASVKATQSGGAFLGAGSLKNGSGVTCCYANGKVESAKSLDETTSNLFTIDENQGDKQHYAQPYDEALKVNQANPQYPYKTTVELYAEAAASKDTKIENGSKSLKYGNKHIGDFCPTEETVDTFVRFLNGPRLYAEVFAPLKENETNYLTLVLAGTDETDPAQVKTNYIAFEAKVYTDNTISLNTTTTPNSKEYTAVNQAVVVTVDEKKYLAYRILLDDISQAKLHFSDITKEIRVGSNITAYAIAENKKKDDTAWYTDKKYLSASVDAELMKQLMTEANKTWALNLSTAPSAAYEQYVWDDAGTAVYDTDNSLFGRNSTPLNADSNAHTAYILSCRHLENLDHYVSKLENTKGSRDSEVQLPETADTNAFSFTKAEQQMNLDWNQYVASVGEQGKEFYIYKPNSSSPITENAYFYGIQNLLLTEYNGNYHSISNLRMQSDKDDYNTAGLFAAVSSKQQTSLTIKNLKLWNVSSCVSTSKNGKKNSAAALLGYYGSNQNQNLTIENVVVHGADVKSVLDAGGLIGYADGKGTLSIKNATVYGDDTYQLRVSSDGKAEKDKDKKDTSGSASAGGLIGRIPSGNSLSVSISGSSVYGQKALVIANGYGKTNDYTDDSAGGLVGTILSGTLNIDNCGVAAYVYNRNGDCCGGLVGDFSANGSIQNSYVAGLTNGEGSFGEFVALNFSSQTVVSPGGYTIYGHLATGGLVGYNSRAVQIDHCFMTASVSENGTNCAYYSNTTTPMCFLGGLIGQLGGGSGGHIQNCYVAGKLWDDAQYNTQQRGYNWFTGSIIGYSESGVDSYAANVYCLEKYGYTKKPKCYVGGAGYKILYSDNNLNGCSAVSKDRLQDTNQTAESTESFDSSLTDRDYPLMTWTCRYTPAEILDGRNDLNAAPLRYIGDWCF